MHAYDGFALWKILKVINYKQQKCKSVDLTLQSNKAKSWVHSRLHCLLVFWACDNFFSWTSPIMKVGISVNFEAKVNPPPQTKVQVYAKGEEKW